MRWIRLALAFAAVATVYFYRLDRPLLWGDEGHTAAMARGILRSGVPSAFDGRNLVLFDIRAGLNRGLVSKEVPWVQWYVGAFSLALFGKSTAGLRMLFALCGLLAFFPLWAALRRRVKEPELVAALALIAPQAALFDRNARYYPIVVLLFACLVWHLSTEFRSGKMRFALSTLIFVLLFHTHTLIALCTAASIAIFCLLGRRQQLPGYVASAAIGFGSWIVWYKLMGPPLTDSPLYQTWAPVRDFGDWCLVTLRSVLAMIVDMDVVGSLPLLLLAVIVSFLFFRNRKSLKELCREPLFGFVLIGIGVQAAATAAVSGTETAAKFAVLRYMPHFAVFALVACLVALDRLVTAAIPFAVGCVLAVACNLGTFSFWARPFGREPPVSWVVPVYADLFNPPPEAMDDLITELRLHSPPSWAGERAIISVPPWSQATLIFYLGDLYIIPPDYLHQPGSHVEQGDPYVRETLGEAAYSRLNVPPVWLVDTIGAFKRVPDGMSVAGVFPSCRARPDDGARPELTRHTFFESAPVAAITVYQWQTE